MRSWKHKKQWKGVRTDTFFICAKSIKRKLLLSGSCVVYGRENAENRGVTKFYNRAHDSKNAEGDPFALPLEDSESLHELYLNAEHEDGYIRDQSVFGDGIGIGIEDRMNVLVKYKSGAQMSYSLTAYSPREGFRVVFTGTKGRMELDVGEQNYVHTVGELENEGALAHESLRVYPM